MKQATLILMMVIVMLSAVNCEKTFYKVNEKSSLPLDLGPVCGDDITYVYNALCNSVALIVRRKRAVRRGKANNKT